jgi:hypothetical protein
MEQVPLADAPPGLGIGYFGYHEEDIGALADELRVFFPVGAGGFVLCSADVVPAIVFMLKWGTLAFLAPILARLGKSASDVLWGKEADSRLIDAVNRIESGVSKLSDALDRLVVMIGEANPGGGSRIRLEFPPVASTGRPRVKTEARARTREDVIAILTSVDQLSATVEEWEVRLDGRPLYEFLILWDEEKGQWEFANALLETGEYFVRGRDG